MSAVRIGDATLYEGDCREVLQSIDQSAAIISDPPYGIGYTHSGAHRFNGVGVTKAARLRGVPPIIGDNEPFDPSHLFCVDNVLIWGADHYRGLLPMGGRWLAWNKLDDMAPWDSFSDVEFAWHSKPGASRIFNLKWKGIVCDKRLESGERFHPTQKPIGLMLWCIEQTGCPSLICDPYLGSGTTGIAASMLGIPFIGIEIERRWFDIACRRIEEAQRQGRLFEPPRAKPVQERFL